VLKAHRDFKEILALKAFRAILVFRDPKGMLVRAFLLEVFRASILLKIRLLTMIQFGLIALMLRQFMKM
jgi:hypothetical protein